MNCNPESGQTVFHIPSYPRRKADALASRDNACYSRYCEAEMSFHFPAIFLFTHFTNHGL